MSDVVTKITVDAGASVRLLTAGKYCDRDILIVANGVPSPLEEKDVNFYDYDGTLLHSYTFDEVQSLNVLPEAPSHDLLIFSRWNWGLGDIKSHNQKLNVSAVYDTDDGSSFFNLLVDSDELRQVEIALVQTKQNGVVIDWGDGSGPESVADLRAIFSHRYNTLGGYLVKLTPVNDATFSLGSDATNQALGSISGRRGLMSSLVNVLIGRGVSSINNYAFRYCSRLAAVSLSPTLASVGGYAFQNCKNLSFASVPSNTLILGKQCFQATGIRAISLPKKFSMSQTGCFYNAALHKLNGVDMDSVYGSCFRNSEQLCFVSVSDSAEFVGAQAFLDCPAIVSVELGSRVASIGSLAFRNNTSLMRFRVKSINPPTLEAADVFQGVDSNFVIYVPHGALEAYQTATNWTAYADYMQEEPE